MTASPSAPEKAGMPTEERIADLIANYPRQHDWANTTARAVLALFAEVMAEKEREIVAMSDHVAHAGAYQAAAMANLDRALAAEEALAVERERVCDVTTAMCEKWIATFSGREINHTPAHEYAEGAVRDIMDQVAAIRQGE